MIDLDSPTRISWFRIFNDLKAGGWSLYRIEAEMGVAKTTLLGWKSGAEPRHADGEMLISLWQTVTSKQRENLPIEKRFENAYHRK